jgi:hypothetical protein
VTFGRQARIKRLGAQTLRFGTGPVNVTCEKLRDWADPSAKSFPVVEVLDVFSLRIPVSRQVNSNSHTILMTSTSTEM